MRKFFSFILLIGFVFYITSIIGTILFHEDFFHAQNIGLQITNKAVQQTGAINTVTSVVVLYRGFDTLGEVTVLFLAALGISLLLGGQKKKNKIDDESFILKHGSFLMYPFIVLFGIYIILHGHLSPGGGFPGGVVIATAFFIILITSEVITFNDKALAVIEGLAGLTFIILGLIGLFGPQQSFLANFLNTGVPGKILSAGIIPFIYAVVGIKVASELSGAIGTISLPNEGSENE